MTGRLVLRRSPFAFTRLRPYRLRRAETKAMTPAARSSARQSNRVGSAVRTGGIIPCTLLPWRVARCCCLPP